MKPVKKTIRELIKKANNAYSVSELAEIIYDVSKPEKKHSVSILRAIKQLISENPEIAKYYHWHHGNEVIIYMATSPLSTAIGNVKRQEYRQQWQKAIERLDTKDLEEGGQYWQRAEDHKTKLYGTNAEKNAIEKRRQEELKALFGRINSATTGEPPPEELIKKAADLIAKAAQQTTKTEWRIKYSNSTITVSIVTHATV